MMGLVVGRKRRLRWCPNPRAAARVVCCLLAFLTPADTTDLLRLASAHLQRATESDPASSAPDVESSAAVVSHGRRHPRKAPSPVSLLARGLSRQQLSVRPAAANRPSFAFGPSFSSAAPVPLRC